MPKDIIGKNAREAALQLASISIERRNNALKSMKHSLSSNRKKILVANKKDLTNAKKSKQGISLVQRLALSDKKIDEMIAQVEEVITLEDPIGKTISAMELSKGLELFQLSVPLGVIGFIFESRPDASMQISALCIKSANAAILKGGSEARHTNKLLFTLIGGALSKNGFPKNSIQLLESREDVKSLLKMEKHIDLLIPRGSSSLVRYIQENTRIPVLGHSEGICHVYVDSEADLDKAVRISVDAKCQYPAACNSMETLLVHKDIAHSLLERLIPKFLEKKVELRLDRAAMKLFKNLAATNEKIRPATDTDWDEEYNDLILSIKIVSSVHDAIEHINSHGSKHTESIVTENKKTALQFVQNVDASSVMVNASTRFADGFRYGKGAEVGISTSKIHARGPVGLEGLTIYKYVIIGSGDTVFDFSQKKKRFTHKKLGRGFSNQWNSQ